MSFAQLARFPGLRFNDAMRGGAVLVLLGITALGAYSVGRQNVPASNAPVPVMTSPPVLAKPVAFSGPAQAPALPSSSAGSPTPSAKADLPDKPIRSDNKRKVEAALYAYKAARLDDNPIILEAQREAKAMAPIWEKLNQNPDQHSRVMSALRQMLFWDKIEHLK
jgi:hypothetical protein